MAIDARVLVLMATRNGQEHLADQLDSILLQHRADITLRIVDEGSTDSTFRILETYAAEHPNIELVYGNGERDVAGALLQLVYEAPADEFDFFALAGQADIWHPDKIVHGIAHISANTSRPELYYSGINAIDACGKMRGMPLAQHDVCAAHPGTLLLARNWALGSTMLMNGALVKLLRRRPVFDVGRGHDAWIHAVALYCGGYVYADLGNPLVDVRMDREAARAFAYDEFDEDERLRLTAMADALLRAYGSHMDDETFKLVEAVSVRAESAKARRHLLGRPDIMLPSSSRTSKLRWKILRNRL